MSSIRVIREEQSESRAGGVFSFLARQLAKLWPKKKAKRPGVIQFPFDPCRHTASHWNPKVCGKCGFVFVPLFEPPERRSR